MVPDLPIFKIRDEILGALRTTNRLILQAPTGSGKSTQVPQFLLDEGMAPDHEIWVLQPRRVAARLLARRVALERGGEVGQEVGYSVRFQSAVSRETRLRFVTEGILLRRLTTDPSLEGLAAVILDEFHERHLETDLALARLRQLQEAGRKDLKLVVMSATLDSKQLIPYLEPCYHLKTEGRSYPVEIDYLPKPDERRIWEVAADAFGRLDPGDNGGDILIFMPGAFEIHQTLQCLRQRGLGRNRGLLPLYGDLPPGEQDAAISPSPHPRIIVATNLAETSVTIAGIRWVIDGGLAKMAGFDPHRGINTLLTRKISQASAEQRAGRAGRTGPGRCLRLWTQREHEGRPWQTPAEIHRLDLSEAILSLKASGVQQLSRFPWFETPRAEAIDQAVQLLTDLDALDAEGGITAVGQQMLRLPTHPRYARMLVEAGRFDCVAEAALLTALAQARPFLRKTKDKAVLARRDDLVGEERHSDLLGLIRLWHWAQQNNYAADPCRELAIHPPAAREVAAIASQLVSAARSAGLSVGEGHKKFDQEVLCRCILAGFVDHLAHRRDQGTLRCDLIHRRRGTLARESAIRDAPLFVAAEIREIEQKGGTELTVLLSLATRVEEAWLKELSPAHYVEREEVEYDAVLKRVVAVRRRFFHDLELYRQVHGTPDPDQAAVVLAREVAAGNIRLKSWDDNVERWLRRVAFLKTAAPELGLPSFDDDEKQAVLQLICHGAASARELRQVPVLPVLEEWLSPEQRGIIGAWAPERISLPGGRKARITYPDQGEPYLATRFQDLFGLQETPSIVGGRHPLLIHLLAPNQRPIQITKDLASFWSTGYASARQELQRRYPKHAWPENPREASKVGTSSPR